MARINPVKKLMHVKIVYYGPGRSGKTTNLVQLHGRYPDTQRGELVKLDTESERTLFFDYFPAELGAVAGYRLTANFFTVPGQSFYGSTRRAVLDAADGVVFIADSSPEREEANLESLADMRENLASMGREIDDMPLVFQWNKRDAPGALSERLLALHLNPSGRPAVAATALTGEGVWETQALILQAVLADLRARVRSGRGLG